MRYNEAVGYSALEEVDMKLWGSVRQGAAKVAFEADKMVRVRKQEQAIAEVEKQVREHFVSLGESVLDL